MKVFSVRVDGIPRPQGSLTPYGTVNGKTRFAHSPHLLVWREKVVSTVEAALPSTWEPIGPDGCALHLTFVFARPQKHFTSKGALRPDAPRHLTTGTDLDKLVRAVFDALTIAGVMDDDRRVTIERSEKRYADEGEVPGVLVEVWSLKSVYTVRAA